MLRTIAECDKALELLEIEREYILKARKFLEENGPQFISPRPRKVKRDKVLEIVLNHPGIDGKTVKAILEEEGFDVTKRQAQSSLSNLARDGEIENRGKHGLGARWYIKEPNARKR